MTLDRRSILRYAGGAAVVATAAATGQSGTSYAAASRPRTSAETDPVEVFQRFITATENNDWTGLANCYSVDTVVEIPFAPPGVDPVTNGRAALLARFEQSAGVVQFTSVDPVSIRRTDDPTVICTEYTVNGTVVKTGKAFSFQYATVTTIKDGEITHSRDYSNPLAGAEAMDQLPALFSALTGGTCT
ncbi:nuclear transport factor 2 family protein [Streptomyces sp. NPDC059740]|uniref:nuclear transport factor 2 family protein n=1 Tax=Streptomyces sp. NPDC059740 TaxID=3346926 RepID=UPI00365C37C1